MTVFHPRKGDNGKLVEITHPSQPSTVAAWSDPNEIATATPESPMPAAIAGIAVAAWKDAPADSAGWQRLASGMHFEEPAMKTVQGKAPASGAVVLEADGRVWVVSPTNRFGGYANTFPKGKVDLAVEASLRANAIREVFEESGLQIALTGFLCDSVRTTSVTRYYLAQRLGGNPAAMGWESQAVHLVPRADLLKLVSHGNDEPVIRSLQALRHLLMSDIAGKYGFDSVHRILAAIAGFRNRFGHWPTSVLVHRGTLEAIPGHALTGLGWRMLLQRLDVIAIDEGTVIAAGAAGERFEYDANHTLLAVGPSVSFWIWGVKLEG